MASASPVLLTQQLLQRNDRHPGGTLNGDDLAQFEQRVVEQFLQLGILVQHASLALAGDLVFQRAGERVAAFSVDGEEPTRIEDPALLQQYEIDTSAICRQLRRANRLGGPPVEALNARVFRIGETGTGNRRRQYFLVRLLRNDNAIDTAFVIKGRAGVGPIVILTPTHRDLSPDVLRRLQAEGIAISAIPDLLSRDAPEILGLDLRTAVSSPSSDARVARLIIDIQGMRAHFDNGELTVGLREFRTLTILANEAVDGQGVVPRDRIYAAMMEDDETAPVANDEQIDKSMSLLRRALSRASGLPRKEAAALIVNKRKVGYRLDLKPSDIHIS